ncbi:MobA/MobL family protein [Fusobacterium nucleatum]|uniref:MobA/MobL family protein n=2 Tax=Fusobacterium nucleatum TaxID=851 RepID=UPI0030D2471D
MLILAHYRLSMKNGKAGGAVANFQYNMGIGKYLYKENEIITSFHNIPEWAESPVDFWQKYSLEDRANSSYKKIELSLQDELSLEENLKILNEFIEKNIGKDFYYSVVIHDKESNEKGIQNTHAHIMICKRKEDGIKRTPEQFFKRYSSKHPETGGALTDNKYWKNKQTLLNMRENWEQIINNCFEKNNIKKRVSCQSLKTQREEALKNNEFEKAEMLNRPAQNIEGYILKKDEKDLTDKEKEKIEEYNDIKEYRSLKELVYSLELQRAEYELAELEKENVVKEKELKNGNIFAEIFDNTQNLFMMSIEKKSLEEKLSNDELLRKSAIRELNKEYGEIELKIDVLSKDKNSNFDEINNLQNKLEEIEDKTSDEKIKKKVTEIASILHNKLNNLFFAEQKLEVLVTESISNLGAIANSEKFYNEYQYNNWEMNYIALKDKEREIDKITIKLENIKNELNEKQLNTYTYNSLTKGEYSKLKTDLDNIEERLFNHHDNAMSDEEHSYLSQRKKVLETKIANIEKKYSKGEDKNKFIRRKYSIKNKYYENFLNLKNELEKNKMEISYLKNNILDIPHEKEKEFQERYRENKLNIENRTLKSKLYKIEVSKKQLELKLTDTSLEKLALNKLTEGKYEKLLKDYSNLLLEEKNINDVSQLTSVKLEIENLEKQQKELLSNIDNKSFYLIKNAYSKKIKSELYQVEREIRITESKIAKNEEVMNRKSDFRGSYKKLKDFSINNVKAELGNVLYTGTINIDDTEDKWEKQIKREMDFSR